MTHPADPSAPGEAAPDLLDSPGAGRKIVRGGAIRIAGFGIGLIASVAAAALVARHLGPTDLGRFQTVIALTTIIQIVADFGMTVLGLREFSQRTGEDRRQFMRVLLGLRLAATAFGISVALIAAALLGFDHEQIIGAGLMGLGFALSTMGGTLGIPLQADLRIGLVTAIDIARQVLTALLFVALVGVGAGIVPFLGAPIPVYVLLLFVTLFFVWGTVPLRPSFDLRAWGKLLRPTVAVALATSVGSLYLYTAMLITEQVTSEFETGLFAAAFRVYVIAASVPALLVTIAFPLLARAARDDRERLAYAAQKLLEASALVGGVALLGCVLGAEPIIAVIAGDQYTGAIDVLRVQGAALAITFVIATWGFTLLALHLHRPMVLANLLALVVSAVTVLILARSHGAVGAAFGTLFGEIALASAYIFALARHDPALRPRIGLLGRAIAALLVALAVGIVLPFGPLVGTTAALLVYLVAALGLGAVPSEIRDHLPGPMRRLGASA